MSYLVSIDKRWPQHEVVIEYANEDEDGERWLHLRTRYKWEVHVIALSPSQTQELKEFLNKELEGDA